MVGLCSLLSIHLIAAIIFTRTTCSRELCRGMLERTGFFKPDAVFKEANSIDKSVMEKIILIDGLDKKEKAAFFIMLDALVAKKRLLDTLNTTLGK